MILEKDTLVFTTGKKLFKRFTSQRDRERIYNYHKFSKVNAKKKSGQGPRIGEKKKKV